MRPAAILTVTLAVMPCAPLSAADDPPAVAPAATEAEGDSAGRIRTLIREQRFVEAVDLARAHLARTEAAHGDDAVATAEALELLIETLNWSGRSDRSTVALAERALAIRERHFGATSSDLLPALLNLGLVLRYPGDYAGSVRAFERALGIAEASLPAGHPDIATCLVRLADALRTVGDYKRALELAERSLALREKALGPDHPDVAKSLTSSGVLLRDAGDYARARDCFTRALAIREKSDGPDHIATAAVLKEIGLLDTETGDFAAARAAQERALAINEKTFGDHPDTAVILHGLGFTLYLLGDRDGARSVWERGLAMLGRAGLAESALAAGLLRYLGGLEHQAGRPADARRYFERSLALTEKILGPKHVNVSGHASALGFALIDLNDLPGALVQFQRSLEIEEGAGGPDHPRVAMALGHIAQVLCLMERCAEGQPLSERALAIQEKALGPDHPDVAYALDRLGDALIAGGDPEGALRHYSRALDITVKTLGEDHADVAFAHRLVGNALVMKEDLERGIGSHTRALAIYEKVLGPDCREVAVQLSELSRLHFHKGDDDAALALALRAERIARERFRQTARVLAEGEALQVERIRTTGLDVAMSVFARGSATGARQADARLLFDAVVRARAMVLEEVADRHRAISGADSPAIGALVTARDEARDRLARLMVRSGGDTDAAGRSGIAAAREALERAERALAEQSAAAREEFRARSAGLDAIGAALPAGGALVSYLRFRQNERLEALRGSDGRIHWRPEEPAYAAFVLRDGALHVVPLGSEAALAELVRQWQAAVSVPPRGVGRSARRAEARLREAGGRLRRVAWDPIAPHLEGAAWVAVVPDGLLALVNVAALPDAVEGRYLVETMPLLHYLSAERDLLRHAAPRKEPLSLMVFGDPQFNAFPAARGEAAGTMAAAAGGRPVYRGPRSACGDFRSLRFAPLPGSRTEAGEIARLWRRRGGDAPGGVAIRIGADATEAEFKREAGRHAVLHLATHGFVLGDACGPARIPAVAGGLPSGVYVDPSRPQESPLLLSGLALAGANRRDEIEPDADLEDGILTAEEIASLDLSRVEWVVLSGCRTGVGELQAGEGVLGLRRAFEVAGARRVIMTLWSVDDSATRGWMQDLYRALHDGADLGDAVRSASLRFIAARRKAGRSTHPFFWGAFVATGVDVPASMKPPA